MASPSPYGMVAGMREFYKNPLFSDLTIICGNTEFKVHRNILFAQSPYFRKLLSGGFKVRPPSQPPHPPSQTDHNQESRTEQNVITLEGHAPCFETMIHYFYHSFYDDSARGLFTVPEHAIFVYATADKYDFPRLRDAAANKFKDACNPQDDVEAFVNAVYLIDRNTTPTDRTLWNIVLPKMKANISKLCESANFIKLATVDMPHLAVHLFRQLDPVPSTAAGPVPGPGQGGAGGRTNNGDHEYESSDDNADLSIPSPSGYSARPRDPRTGRPIQTARKRNMGPGHRLG
jgi:hypothetical protein